ncbi:hypothetical protein [Streptomyces sp. NPDC048142]|uniref:hypothetical protein n=1 Tax=Streptomyces sp. NPDC048142 TaxID=3365501 RepID=UPI0037180DF5
MADRYPHLTATTPGRFLTRRAGLPRPAAPHRRPPHTPRLDAPHAVAPDAPHPDPRPAVLDALHPAVRSPAPVGRIVVIGRPPSSGDHHQAAAQRVLEGLARSPGKGTGLGSTARRPQIPDGATPQSAEFALHFPLSPLPPLSPRSAYVSGQMLRVCGQSPLGARGR